MVSRTCPLICRDLFGKSLRISLCLMRSFDFYARCDLSAEFECVEMLSKTTHFLQKYTRKELLTDV